MGRKGGWKAEFLTRKHKSRILGHSFIPVCGFSMIEQVRLCAVCPIENWLGSSLNHIQARTTVPESYSRALEQGPLDGRGMELMEGEGEGDDLYCDKTNKKDNKPFYKLQQKFNTSFPISLSTKR